MKTVSLFRVAALNGALVLIALGAVLLGFPSLRTEGTLTFLQILGLFLWTVLTVRDTCSLLRGIDPYDR